MCPVWTQPVTLTLPQNSLETKKSILSNNLVGWSSWVEKFSLYEIVLVLHSIWLDDHLELRNTIIFWKWFSWRVYMDIYQLLCVWTRNIWFCFFLWFLWFFQFILHVCLYCEMIFGIIGFLVPCLNAFRRRNYLHDYCCSNCMIWHIQNESTI